MKMQVGVTGAAALALSLVAIPALADDYPPCDEFTLTGGKFEVVTFDEGPRGESLGDERLGERELLAADGTIVGMLRWISQVIDIEKGRTDNEVALNQIVYTLPDGTLHADGQMHYVDITAADTQPSDDSVIAVVGGTGAYVRSQGEILSTFDADGTSQFVFRLYCN